MTFNGFANEDFEVFQLNGLDERMEAIRERIQPKFITLAEQITPLLSGLTGEEMFYHVAKHARRTVNPPKDTWVAFASNKRGYKKHPHFQVGLWPTHLFIRLAVIYECPQKEQFAKAIQKNGQTIIKQFPKEFVWSDDHTKPETMDMFNPELLKRLSDVKKAEFLVGLDVNQSTVVDLGGKLLPIIEKTLKQLAPLYNEMKQVLVQS